MKPRKICIISNYYPSEFDPIYSFVDEVVCGFADRDIECVVITPTSITEKEHKAHSRKKKSREGKIISIYCPPYLSVSDKRILGIDLQRITCENSIKSAYKAYKKFAADSDLIYGHFLNLSGITASYIAKREKKPCIVACGESSFDTAKSIYELYKDEIRGIDGIVSVSTENQQILKSMGLLNESTQIRVIPNGVDLTKFYPIAQEKARKELGLSLNTFIVAFVGHFIERKGIGKVVEAINQVPGAYGLFIGGTELPYKCEKAIFVGKVPHDKLRLYLSASDVFVLPTLNEGCCNSILEAQACGLPIISSNRAFNEDILPLGSAMLIDPLSMSELVKSLEKVKESPDLRKQLKKESIRLSKERDIQLRIDNIIRFIDEITE